MGIKKTLPLKSVPVLIDTHGQYDVEYRIYVACRDGKIYFFKNGVIQDFQYSIESKPVGMVRLDKTIMIAGMNSVLYSFYLKGKKNFSQIMPAQITNICKMELKRTHTI
jgi:Bardet-Biedl syndrome 1 protein